MAKSKKEIVGAVVIRGEDGCVDQEATLKDFTEYLHSYANDFNISDEDILKYSKMLLSNHPDLNFSMIGVAKFVLSNTDIPVVKVPDFAKRVDRVIRANASNSAEDNKMFSITAGGGVSMWKNQSK